MNRGLIAAGAATLLALAACSDGAADADSVEVSTTETLAGSLADAPDLSTARQALTDAGLNTVFDGVASYTLFAPTDEAFAAIDADLDGPGGEAALAAVLRDHVVAGALTRDDIATAIASAGGPVEMRTMGTGTLTFSGTADDLVVTSSDGVEAHIAGTVLRAANGAVFPIDTVLKNFAEG